MFTEYENNSTYSVVIMMMQKQMYHFNSEKSAEKTLFAAILAAILNFRLWPISPCGTSLYLVI
jgi:hypothetical protein